MSHLAPLIADLALILICAGLMTLIFKKLKQPLVLGYIVAGFFASSHWPYIPSVVDMSSIRTWADIGVIFLLFALGLEFSLKKIVKVGGAAIIAATTIIFCMILLGMTVGALFGWSKMDSIFLGGMIAMSSTTIIYKAFDDLGLQKKQFAGLVLSILILEDILAIVLMVMLSTMAVSHDFEGTEMLGSIAKLLFFLILWFVVGIYIIPGFLKLCKKLMNDETMLIVSLGLCFGMVVTAAKTGFSPAFGAFIMGSILAETVEAERIQQLTKPVKDLFGAIFFVSVGMMVDPQMIVEYAFPIIVITLAVILGQSFFGTIGVMLSGKPLKTAMQCGFSLTQIGEFAFIIASLGVSLHVTSHFLYPIVVAVSVITTFITPYMIRLAGPASEFMDRKMPEKWSSFFMRYSDNSQTMEDNSLWKRLIMALVRITVVYAVISIAIVAVSFKVAVPVIRYYLPNMWGNLLAAFLTILFISPFLRAIMIKKNHSIEFEALWKGKANRPPLVATIVLRVILAVVFLIFIISHIFHQPIVIVFGPAFLLVIGMVYSRSLKKQSIIIERKFFQNLNSREMYDQSLREKKPAYAGRLLSKDLHLSSLEISPDSPFVGQTLAELNIGKKFNTQVVSVARGTQRFNIPGGKFMLYPHDKIQVIATDEDISRLAGVLEQTLPAEGETKHEVTLHQFRIMEGSPLKGHTLRDSGIREKNHCLIVGVERGDNKLHAPNPNEPFEENDVVWVVGEEKNIELLVAPDGNDLL